MSVVQQVLETSAGPRFDRAPPYSPEAETSVLGGMLIDRDAVAKAIEVLSEPMFYREANRRLYRAMVRIFERGDVVDVVTLAEELSRTDELESSGGHRYLSELVDKVPTAANLAYHAKIVREKALLRRLIESAHAIVQNVYSQGERQVEELLDEAEQQVFQVAQSHDREGFVWIKEILWETFEYIEQRQATGGGITGVGTGFPDLDRMTSGFQKGDLVILAARPSMGKTAFVLNVAQHAAIKNKVPVAMFSLEMSKTQLVQRMLFSEARVDAQGLKVGKRLHQTDFQRLSKAASLLHQAPIWIDDSPGLNILEMRAKARRLKAESDIGLLIVDYMQLMSGQGKSDNRQQEVSDISRGLKSLARELEVPLVALSQLSRAPEQRTDHRPQLSDLRESGSIEQDADLVMFLYRPEYYARPEEVAELAGQSELIIGKQRNGPTGTVNLSFNNTFTRFDSVLRHGPGSEPDYHVQ